MSVVPGTSARSGTSRLVLVTGAGRSGTSTMAGTLARLGFHVPQPVLEANESNPRGFYESWWPVRFHNRLMKRTGTTPTDGRPAAASLMEQALDESARSELREWMSTQFDANPMVMVKDPRAAWVPGLWSSTATSLGLDISFLTMIRHPTEVISSRKTYYTSNQSPAVARTYMVRQLCGWVNQNISLERSTRGQSRSFVSYVDLVSGWRPTVAKVLVDLHLQHDVTFAESEKAIDAFVEKSLRRHQAGWDGFDLPQQLVDIAEATWQALSALTESGGRDEAAESALDEVARQYARLYADASAISWDQAEARARTAWKEARRDARKEVLERQADRGAQPRLASRAFLSIRGAILSIRRASRR